MRQEVKKFAMDMELVLQKNDYKKHWSGCSIVYLQARLHDEVKELDVAMRDIEAFTKFRGVKSSALPLALKEAKKEATDVANFCMMLSDNIDKLIKETINEQE